MKYVRSKRYIEALKLKSNKQNFLKNVENTLCMFTVNMPIRDYGTYDSGHCKQAGNLSNLH